jgi:hypothetical protein
MWLSRRSTPSHHADKFDAVAVLENAVRPFVAGEGLLVELDEELLGIEAEVGGELAEGHSGADLPRVAVGEDGKATLQFGHGH